MIKKIWLISFLSLFFILPFVSAGLTVNSPVTDEIYNSNKVLFNIDSDEVGDFYYLMGDLSSSERWTKLCIKTDKCEKFVRLNDGENNIQIKFVNSDTYYDEILSIIIDSKNPIILKTFLESTSDEGSKIMKYINNDNKFRVIFKEDNMEEVTLYYGTDEETAENTPINDCSFNEDKKWTECIVEDVELSDYDNKEIIYLFEVKDEAGHISKSRISKVKVDTTTPIIKNNEVNYEINKKKVNFAIEIEEKNFAGVFYWDSKDSVQKWMPLCNKLNSVGRCTTMKSFSLGDHILDIKVIDKAGNLQLLEEELDFTIY